MIQSYPYQTEAGIRYARAFARYDEVPAAQRLFYYSADDDCTNFVSQCVWAAYGGWIPSDSSEAAALNAGRILRDVRQVKGVWFGSRSHIGSGKWCRVTEFYDYVTRRDKKAGPQADKIAEGTFGSINPRVIREGDIVQMVVAGYAPDRYGHALFVTKGGQTWQDVLICCHTYNRLDEPMTQFALYPQIYRKLRVLRFYSSFFDS